MTPAPGEPADRPVAANKTMGREFARVEPFEGVVEVGAGPYFKLLAANMIINEGFDMDELQEMADRLNTARAHAVESAVKELKAERDALKATVADKEAGLAEWRKLYEVAIHNLHQAEKERDGAVIGLATEIQMGLERFMNENAGPYMPLMGKLWAICNKARMGGKDA